MVLLEGGMYISSSPFTEVWEKIKAEERRKYTKYELLTYLWS
jgi:hypothetical protein